MVVSNSRQTGAKGWKVARLKFCISNMSRLLLLCEGCGWGHCCFSRNDRECNGVWCMPKAQGWEERVDVLQCRSKTGNSNQQIAEKMHQL